MNHYYISISNGLLQGDHQERMGTAVWQFMWCIDKVTKIDADGTGWVLGGKPVNLRDFGNSLSRMTVSRNLQRLEREGYIGLKHTPYGIIISVKKAKKRFNRNVYPGLNKNVEPRNRNVYPRNENVYPNKTDALDSTVDRGSSSRKANPETIRALDTMRKQLAEKNII